jgi:hypothetical protein
LPPERLVTFFELLFDFFRLSRLLAQFPIAEKSNQKKPPLRRLLQRQCFYFCTTSATAKAEFIGYGRAVLLGLLGALATAEPPSKSGLRMFGLEPDKSFCFPLLTDGHQQSAEVLQKLC